MRARDHKYFDALKGAYKGEAMFVIGTGPSLRKEIGQKINRLNGRLCFGVNLLAHCITAEDAFMDFIPQFWGVGEIDWLRNIEATIAGFKTERILGCEWDVDFPHKGAFPEWNWVWRPRWRRMEDGWFGGFEEELNWVADGGGVVVDVCVQLAAWMGCNPVYLLGCEATVSGHAYSEKFEPPSRDAERQGMVQRAAARARREYEKRGMNLIDLSGPTGTLPLEKMSFDEVTK